MPREVGTSTTGGRKDEVGHLAEFGWDRKTKFRL